MTEETDLKDCCANCKVTNCIDLFRHTKKDDEFTGGELYVYKLLNHAKVMNKDFRSYTCVNGVLLRCACYIIGTAYTLNKNHFLTIICNEIVPDMKASYYLAMSGHYRQAILIQRCVFENFLYGLYFHSEDYIFSKNATDREDVLKKFNEWFSGGFRKSDDYLLDIIKKAGHITKNEKKEWGHFFNTLSEFIHTLRHTPTAKMVESRTTTVQGCYSEVKFDEEKLVEWSKYYQKLFLLIIYKLIMVYPRMKKKLAVKLALKHIKAEFKDIKEEVNDSYLDELLKMRSGKVKKS